MKTDYVEEAKLWLGWIGGQNDPKDYSPPAIANALIAIAEELRELRLQNEKWESMKWSDR